MAVTITSRPIVSGCNWNAAGNPIVYKLQRKDANFNQINNSGGFIQVQFNGVDITVYFAVNSSVYLKSDNGVYDIFGTITASSFSGGNTLVTLNKSYVSSSTAGYLNNNSINTDYRIGVEIFRSSDNTSVTDGVTLSFSPSSKGLFMADVSAIVKNFLEADWNNPASVNEVEANTSLKFYIKYQEYYDGAFQGSVVSDSATPLVAVFAAMQIGSSNGGNMLAYFTDDDTKLWLNKFQLSSALNKAVLWRDWPFTLSFIWNSGITNIFTLIREYDASVALVSFGHQALTIHPDAINRVKIDTAGISTNTKKIIIELIGGTVSSGSGSSSLYIAVSNDLVDDVAMRSRDGENWTVVASAALSNWYRVAYGNGVLVAVSTSASTSSAMRSTDNGLTWTSSTTPNKGWIDVVFDGTVFVAVTYDASNSSQVITSPDGETWTTRTSSTVLSWASIAVGPSSRLVAVSANVNGIMTSDDHGVTWVTRTVAVADNFQAILFVDFLGLYVVVGSRDAGGGVMTSPDAVTWTNRTSAADYEWKDLACSGNIIVAVASNAPGNDAVMTSVDGINWVLQTTPNSNSYLGVCFFGELFVAVSGDGADDRVMTSPNGEDWTQQTTSENSWTGVVGLSLNTDSIIFGTNPEGEYSFVGEITISGANAPALTIGVYNGGVFVSTIVASYDPGLDEYTYSFDPTVLYNIPDEWDRLLFSVSGDDFFTYEWSVFIQDKYTSPLEIEVRDVCDYNAELVPIEGKNPIHLFWKNSLGGDAFWNFPLYHEYTYTYSNGKKAKRIILFDTNLHPVQWEALSELNGVGEIYSPAIQELTSSVNATSKRVGQQVYIISQDGTKKTGVLVIPATDKVFSRDSAYRISIEIELPEVFSI